MNQINPQTICKQQHEKYKDPYNPILVHTETQLDVPKLNLSYESTVYRDVTI